MNLSIYMNINAFSYVDPLGYELEFWPPKWKTMPLFQYRPNCKALYNQLCIYLHRLQTVILPIDLDSGSFMGVNREPEQANSELGFWMILSRLALPKLMDERETFHLELPRDRS